MFYTQVDEKGYIYRSMYTQNAEAAVPTGHRLLPDSGAPTTGYDTSLQRPECVQPTPLTAKQIEYRIVDIPNEELAHGHRGYRNQLLTESDWTQLLDSPLSPTEREAWVAYRKALRDIPLQAGFPRVVAWPETP
jgi:hypothetical protein